MSKIDQGLLDLRILVRVGHSALTKSQFRQGMSLADRIVDLSGRLEASVPRDDELRYVERLVLQAEFEYSFGRQYSGTAARRLDDETRELQSEFARWRVDGGKGFGDAREVLRRKIWALMSFAFYSLYAAGEVERATEMLEGVLRLIDTKLAPPSDPRYQAHGTRSRLCEYLAQVYRTARNPRASEMFHRAQRHAESRLLEVRKGEFRRAAEQHFAFVTTARVLGGLGRLALLRGELTQALQLLRAAHTLVIPGGNETLQRVIRSHVAVANRRSVQFGSTAWDAAIEELADLWRDFSAHQDYDGMRRCSYELAQAWIEYAEISMEASQQAARASEARGWVERFDEASRVKGMSGRLAAALEHRSHLLRAFLYLFEPNLDAARYEVERAERVTKGNFDLAGCDCIDVRLVRGILKAEMSQYEHSGNLSPGKHFKELVEEAQREGDLELAAEATLRAAISEFNSGHKHAAAVTLGEWPKYSPVIENSFLRALRSQAQDLFKPCPPFSPNPDASLSENVAQFKRYMVEWAVAKHAGSRQKAMNLLRTNKSTIQKHLGTPLPLAERRLL